MVILGGQGSLAGVVVGAILISVLLELLRDPGDARDPLLRGGRRRARPHRSSSRRELAVVAGGLVVFGFVAARGRRRDRPRVGERHRGGVLCAAHWVIVPTQLAHWVAPRDATSA